MSFVNRNRIPGILERQKELSARASEATIRKIKAQEEERVALLELRECNKQAEVRRVYFWDL